MLFSAKALGSISSTAKSIFKKAFVFSSLPHFITAPHFTGEETMAQQMQENAMQYNSVE